MSAHYERLKRKRLGDILVSERVVSQDAVISALREQKETHRLLSDILLDSEEITEWELARVVVEQYQLPFVDLSRYSMHKDLVESFPPRLLHTGAFVPLDRFGQQTCIACQEVPSEALIGKIRQVAKGPVFLFVALSLELRRHLHDLAPLEKGPTGEEAAAVAAGAQLGLGKLGEDTSWTGLFDAANEAILSDLPEE